MHSGVLDAGMGREREREPCLSEEMGLKATGARMWDEGCRPEQERLCWSRRYGGMLTAFSACLLQEKTHKARRRIAVMG